MPGGLRGKEERKVAESRSLRDVMSGGVPSQELAGSALSAASIPVGNREMDILSKHHRQLCIVGKIKGSKVEEKMQNFFLTFSQNSPLTPPSPSPCNTLIFPVPSDIVLQGLRMLYEILVPY